MGTRFLTRHSPFCVISHFTFYSQFYYAFYVESVVMSQTVCKDYVCTCLVFVLFFFPNLYYFSTLPLHGSTRPLRKLCMYDMFVCMMMMVPDLIINTDCGKENGWMLTDIRIVSTCCLPFIRTVFSFESDPCTWILCLKK